MSENPPEDELAEDGEMFEHYRFTADPGQAVLRIDKFLCDKIPNTSRNKIQAAAKNGNILVNEAVVKPNHKVKPGDSISIVMPYPVRELVLVPEDLPIDIVYEDDDVLVVNKAAGMVVHPGYGNYRGTLVNALVYHFENLPETKGNIPGRPGLAHRLDKLTTGLMVIGKNESSLAHLSKQFYERTTQRFYNALVWGDFEEDEGTIEGHIGRSLKNRKVMTVFENGEYGKHAVTHFKVLRRFGYVTLVQCKLETGRTHQIRAHFKHIGHPLFNDPDYSGNKVLKGSTFTRYKQFIANCFSMCERQALHAKTLGFEHPVTGKFLQFDSELPDDMQALLEKWENYISSRKD